MNVSLSSVLLSDLAGYFRGGNSHKEMEIVVWHQEPVLIGMDGIQKLDVPARRPLLASNLGNHPKPAIGKPLSAIVGFLASQPWRVQWVVVSVPCCRDLQGNTKGLASSIRPSFRYRSSAPSPDMGSAICRAHSNGELGDTPEEFEMRIRRNDHRKDQFPLEAERN